MSPLISVAALAEEPAGSDPPVLPAALCTGSWSHWVTGPSRPVATGSEPG